MTEITSVITSEITSEMTSEMINENQIAPQSELCEAGAKSLIPISHKDLNEFIKGKGFTGRNNYKLKELKAMFGFKPLTYKNQTAVNIDDGKQLRDFESISKASIGSGIPYTTLIQAKEKSKANPNNPVTIRAGGSVYVIKFISI